MRKFLLFICILAFSATTKAQVERSLYQQHADSLFQYLDKTPISMGILYDRVAQFADLDTLSGLITNNTDPASGYKKGQYVLIIQKGSYKESKHIIIGQ